MDEWGFAGEDEVIGEVSEPSLDGPAWVRRLVGRLGNVRIHDTAQAGELAARLGARGFTVGRDIYLRPDLMRPATARSVALLAHELFHAGEQAGLEPSSMDMPLLMRGATAGRSSAGKGSVGRGGTAVQRSANPNVPAPANLSGSEIAAEAIEGAVVRQGVGANANERAAQEPPSPEDIADKVYSLIARDLTLDRERRAYGW